MIIDDQVRLLYKQYGQSKAMTTHDTSPCFFLHRKFKGENDLLVIFDTAPCLSLCKFCNLSNRPRVTMMSIPEQYLSVLSEVRHSLSILDRLTLSNNGSILDERAVPSEELIDVLYATTIIKNLRNIVLETDFAFLNEPRLLLIRNALGSIQLNILTGFETFNDKIRKDTLGKRWDLSDFEKGLDILSTTGCDFTAYILYKPEQNMTNEDALIEASKSVNYVYRECVRRKINLTFRINPMFAAVGSEWAHIAKQSSMYSPPRLSDILSFAKKVDSLAPTYIGLSVENRSEEWGSYRVSPDFSKELLLETIEFNSKNSMNFKN